MLRRCPKEGILGYKGWANGKLMGLAFLSFIGLLALLYLGGVIRYLPVLVDGAGGDPSRLVF